MSNRRFIKLGGSLELLFPATLGFHDFTDGQNNVGTMTFVPGLRFVYPVLENWWLKPFGQFGFGKDFSGSDIAYFVYTQFVNDLDFLSKYMHCSTFHKVFLP
jgi:hypothetical protein